MQRNLKTLDQFIFLLHLHQYATCTTYTNRSIMINQLKLNCKKSRLECLTYFPLNQLIMSLLPPDSFGVWFLTRFLSYYYLSDITHNVIKQQEVISAQMQSTCELLLRHWIVFSNQIKHVLNHIFQINVKKAPCWCC